MTATVSWLAVVPDLVTGLEVPLTTAGEWAAPDREAAELHARKVLKIPPAARVVSVLEFTALQRTPRHRLDFAQDASRPDGTPRTGAKGQRVCVVCHRRFYTRSLSRRVCYLHVKAPIRRGGAA